MKLETLQNSKYIMYEVIAGSHMYGLNIEGSDIDIRGVFDMPLNQYIQPGCQDQIADEKNDITYYETAKFLSLLRTANPNILELLYADDRFVNIKDSRMDIIMQHKDKFLTKQAKNSLAGYAIQQIKKARGLNKLIVNPCSEKKTILDFCYVHVGGEASMPFPKWAKQNGVTQDMLGLTCVNNFTNTYCAYKRPDPSHWINNPTTELDSQEKLNFITWTPRGMTNLDESSGELRLTSIPKIVARYAETIMISYNKDGYTTHCREYKRYTEWVAKRNPVRYDTNMKHGKNYDSKNMMHCVRLLRMGTELAETGKLNVYRPDRDYLLKIRNGDIEYDELLNSAETYISDLDSKFDASGLPDSVPDALIKDILEEIKLNS